MVEAELPHVARALEAGGAFRTNLIRDLPVSMTGGWRDGDERFDWLTGRRPFVEAVFAAQAAATPGIEIRRGVAVAGLIAGSPDRPRCRTLSASRPNPARRSWATWSSTWAAGARPCPPGWPPWGRRRSPRSGRTAGSCTSAGTSVSTDGSAPPLIGPPKIDWGTISSLSLPADNGTWCLGIVIAAKDKSLFGLRRLDRWEAVVRSLPLVAHFLDGEPIDDGVAVITRLEDRYRGFRGRRPPGRHRCGRRLATPGRRRTRRSAEGSRSAYCTPWCCVTRFGRSASTTPPSSPRRFHDRTAETVEPWYRTTLAGDRDRLAEVDAGILGAPYQPEADAYRQVKSIFAAAALDPDCLRGALDIRSVLKLPQKVFKSDPALADKAGHLAAGAPDPGHTDPTASNWSRWLTPSFT